MCTDVLVEVVEVASGTGHEALLAVDWARMDPDVSGDLAATALLERERLAATEIAPGVLMPHALLPGLVRPLVVVVRPATPSADFRAAITLLVPDPPAGRGAARVRHLVRQLADPDVVEAVASLPAARCRHLVLDLLGP